MPQPTEAALAALTDKEKQTLRLIVRGHDAKSVAVTLGLSVHTINERLRDARRKLAVSSSREAARMLFEAEGATPENLGDNRNGDDVAASATDVETAPDDGAGRSVRSPRFLIGAFLMTLALGLLALTLTPATVQTPPPPPRDRPGAPRPRSGARLSRTGRSGPLGRQLSPVRRRLSQAEYRAGLGECLGKSPHATRAGRVADVDRTGICPRPALWLSIGQVPHPLRQGRRAGRNGDARSGRNRMEGRRHHRRLRTRRPGPDPGRRTDYPRKRCSSSTI